jgi:hypothetical protein
MKVFSLLFFCLILASCSKVEPVLSENTQTNTNNTLSDSKPVQETVPLNSVTPNLSLNFKRKKYLNASLPPQIREILEKAETFEILAEVNLENDGEGRDFLPDTAVKVKDEKLKKEVLENFYSDASSEDSPANCYQPHHGIKAKYQGKTVEVEICFSCSRFIVKSSFGNFEGTIVRKNRKSEDFFEQIVKTQGIRIKTAN